MVNFQKNFNFQTESLDNVQVNELNAKIKDTGDKVRNLKTAKASKVNFYIINKISRKKFYSKEEIDATVKILLSLKDEFKRLTGQEWKPETGSTTRAPKVPSQTI